MPAQAKFQQEQNKLRPEDRSVHDWYRFVLSFPSHLVRNYLEAFSINSSMQILDPFCGTGTTLVECKKLGIPSIGVERNPIAEFASRVKVDWSVDPTRLRARARRIADHAIQTLRQDGIEDVEPLPLFDANRSQPAALRTLLPDRMALLLKNSISPLPLHKVLVLIETLNQHDEDDLRGHERLALAAALVSGVSNLHFGPEVGVRRVKNDAPVIGPWLDRVNMMCDDLERLGSVAGTKTTVCLGDARQTGDYLEPLSIDAVITSPPYPNEKDYTRTTRLESVLLGFIQNKQDLRDLKQGLVRSNTRGVYKRDTDDALVANHEEIQRIAGQIETRRIAANKTSGFERQYARVTKLYFGGMVRHLANLRSCLRPGAKLAYVVGDQASYLRVMIRTGKILGELAQSLGYELARIDLFRTRVATASKEHLREEVVLLRWPG